MNILLVNPNTPDTFWGFKHALTFVSKKATLPPLGLLTVAAMLPKKWNMKLVDMAITKLRNKDIKWADYVFLTAMSIQKESAVQVIDRCKKLGTKIVAGGPLFSYGRDAGYLRISFSQAFRKLQPSLTSGFFAELNNLILKTR